MSTIGQKIMELRKSHGKSQEELAFELGVSRQTISKWEIDAMTPGVENIMSLCKLFNIDANYFFSDKNNATSTEASESQKVVQGSSLQDVKKNKHRMLLVAIILLAVLTVFSILTTIILGYLSLGSIHGDDTVSTIYVEEFFFYGMLVISVGLIVAETILVVKMRRKTTKS